MVIQECRSSINMLLTFIWEILKCIWSVLMKSMLFCPSQIIPCGILSGKCPLRLRNLNTWFPVDNVVGEVLEPFGGRLLMEKVCPWVEKRLCILIVFSFFLFPISCEDVSIPIPLPLPFLLPAVFLPRWPLTSLEIQGHGYLSSTSCLDHGVVSPQHRSNWYISCCSLHSPFPVSFFV